MKGKDGGCYDKVGHSLPSIHTCIDQSGDGMGKNTDMEMSGACLPCLKRRTTPEKAEAAHVAHLEDRVIKSERG